MQLRFKGLKIFLLVLLAALLVVMLSPLQIFAPSAQAQNQELEDYLKIYYDFEKGYYYFKTLSNDSVIMENLAGNISRFTLFRWGNECSLNATLILSGGETEFEFEFDEANNKLKWKGKWKIGDAESEVEIEFEPQNNSEYGAFEWNTVLWDNLTNTFSVPIQTKNLKFYYQPPLYEEYNFSQPFANDTFSVNATHVMNNINGTWITRIYRSVNVVGSYAVYHATRTNMHRSKEDAEKYKTGKAFHIYRPLTKDSAGNTTWCDLNIDEKLEVLTVTVPQEFLDKAVYPVVVDPTFGYDTAGSSNYEFSPNDLVGSRPHSCPEAGTATSLTFYVVASGLGGDIKAAIYKDSDDSLAGYTVEEPINMPFPGWQTLDITSGGDLEATDYILTLWANDEFRWYYDLQANYFIALRTLTYNGFPDPAGWASKRHFENSVLSIYCTYTVAGQAYVADLNQSISSTWNLITKWDALVGLTQTLSSTWSVLTQWNAIVDFSQTLRTTWKVLTQTAYSILPDFSISTSWIVDVITGIVHSVNLTLNIVTTNGIIMTLSIVHVPWFDNPYVFILVIAMLATGCVIIYEIWNYL